ncbi:MAG: hydrolase [Gammaproteobacteria bacterium]
MSTPPEPPAPAAGMPAHGRVVRRGDFVPAAWLPGRHLATIWASLCRRPPPVALQFEHLDLPDGDFLELAWTRPRAAPVVIVLHGLEGSHGSAYVRALLGLLDGAGLRGVLLQFRGCSGRPNRLDRSYHSGDTGDLDFLVRLVTARTGAPPCAVVGYSLGGNVTLKWLGELGAAAPVQTAVAVSVPFDLGACADYLDRGFSRLYQRRLVGSMRRKLEAKFGARPAPLDLAGLHRLRSFRAFDNAVTAPLHGFRDAVDYYERASCRPYLRHIRTPTLIVHAEDDPFVPRSAIPRAAELAPGVTLELTSAGGHVAFVTGRLPWRAQYWCEARILAHLCDVIGVHPGAQRGG